ncbi:hypothetical protein AGMMS50276_28480 [Synergistales bacterium]|nr:hypothetical protein AGMMS50276_28480 [Synergistales bacterium]
MSHSFQIRFDPFVSKWLKNTMCDEHGCNRSYFVDLFLMVDLDAANPPSKEELFKAANSLANMVQFYWEQGIFQKFLPGPDDENLREFMELKKYSKSIERDPSTEGVYLCATEWEKL